MRSVRTRHRTSHLMIHKMSENQTSHYLATAHHCRLASKLVIMIPQLIAIVLMVAIIGGLIFAGKLIDRHEKKPRGRKHAPHACHIPVPM
jgi:hypothetical protein